MLVIYIIIGVIALLLMCAYTVHVDKDELTMYKKDKPSRYSDHEYDYDKDW